MSDFIYPADWQTASPKRILLATDLSCRCDRAQDRAAQLARLWNAKLFVLNVLEDKHKARRPYWERVPSQVRAEIETTIRADLTPPVPEVEIIVETGDAANVTLAKAIELECDFIVTGVSHYDAFGPSVLGSTVNRIVRKAPVPVLVVKMRPRSAYSTVVVATDYSASSRHAVETAVRLFPKANFSLFHAYHLPFEQFMDDEVARKSFFDEAKRNYDAFIASIDPRLNAAERFKPVLECGAPDVLMPSFVRDRQADLAVLGTHGRSAIFNMLIGSTAERLITLLPCDVMVVREPRSLHAVKQQLATAGVDVTRASARLP